MARLFFALTVPKKATRPLELVQAHLPGKDVRLSLTQHFHITFKFLGEVDFMQQTQVQLAVRRLMVHTTFASEDLMADFTRVSFFHKDDVPNVVWVGVHLSAALYQFQYDLQTVLEPFGFAIEKRRFKPHVTVARVNDVKSSTTRNVLKGLPSLGVQKHSFQVGSIELYESHLEWGKPTRYTALESFPFSVL